MYEHIKSDKLNKKKKTSLGARTITTKEILLSLSVIDVLHYIISGIALMCDHESGRNEITEIASFRKLFKYVSLIGS